MPLDPVRVEDTRAWLEKARQDLGAGRADLAVSPPYPGDAMFHAQQAAEKVLKGFLAWHEIIFRKTHDLRELFGVCSRIDPSLRELAERAESLTPYAWCFRYPGERDEPTGEEAEEALALAREVYDAILTRFPDEVRP
jgi:HEPN domain-containing protein